MAAATGHIINQLPTPLLALVASHLPVQSLLCLQRCSQALRRLRADESRMAEAWRWARLVLGRGDEQSTPATSVWSARCRPVLRACPALQHLELANAALRHTETTVEDVLYRVPRLRSLSLAY